jgi:hypothetical protein
MKYRIYGLIIESDIYLNSCVPLISDESADVCICSRDLYSLKNYADKKFSGNYTNEKGEPLWLMQSLSKEVSEICVIDTGVFRVLNGNTIEYAENHNTSKYFFEECLLALCMAIVLIQREQIVVHGSGIVCNNKMIVISGESGSGKSTLTNEFIKNKALFMADDAVALSVIEDRVYGYGTFPLRRLCEDALDDSDVKEFNIFYKPDKEHDKYGIDMKSEFYDNCTELSAMFFIEPQEKSEVSIERIKGAECLKYITDNLYKTTAYKKIGVSSSMMKQCLIIAKNIPMFKIIRPKTGMTVQQQHIEIEELLLTI